MMTEDKNIETKTLQNLDGNITTQMAYDISELTDYCIKCGDKFINKLKKLCEENEIINFKIIDKIFDSNDKDNNELEFKNFLEKFIILYGYFYYY
jgi:hypothetical protein